MTALRALNPILTRDGMRAIFNASDDGLSAKIAHIAFGSSRYTPLGTETALKAEKVRLPVIGGRYLSDYVIELVTLLDHGAGFDVAEMGVILEDGTLLAVWSDADTPLAYFTPGVPIAVSYVLGISALPPGAVEISGDVDLTLFFGSEFAQMGRAILGNALRLDGLGERLATLQALPGGIEALSAQIDRIDDRVTGLGQQIDALTRLVLNLGQVTLTNARQEIEGSLR